MRAPTESLVVFSINSQRFALELAAVACVVRAVAISVLPGAPRNVRGVINVHGKIVPVFDLWRRFGWEGHDLRTADYFVIARAARLMAAIIVDEVEELVAGAAAVQMPVAEILPGLDVIAGAIKFEGEIVFIHDLERFLTSEDERVLAGALAAHER